ncbi:MAG: N-acetyl-gamma-glutamyl-phosphate reductase [Candidatus Azobacteroides pseudotrichonymphae]|jgi:N-acetyl-gamma-glutamyl-phosphate reductase|nr:N-acetyl-gamma-glutamyl-phosphate reductase [Bacteroidales bacterium OttesenSCG-928-I14]GMO32349.1 MAG: N-acetyl-gamma-glutamyl-phosphate reductase [Candidatus Azobacteroides pseudotrichonymphae]
MVKVGIIGGGGYTAGELIRLLINHPNVNIIFVHSYSNAKNKIIDIHTGLIGEMDLIFSDSYDLNEIDVLFLCSAYGDSKKFIETHTIHTELKIIDLSIDFRHKENAGGFVYGLPELNKEIIRKAQYIANPGCFATAVQLALLPLAKKNLLRSEIHINAITGSTGAGVRPTASSHFSWRNNNISVYKAFTHQHLKEITESLNYEPSRFNFIPVRGNFSRGIFATVYTESNLDIKDAVQIYSNYYEDSAFTFISDKNPDLKQVINTNKCILHLEKHGNKLFIISIIDNLLKGASGQAVQNFNLICGLNEKTGLFLKANAF